MDGMTAFAFLTLIAAGGFSIHFCIKRSYKLGFEKGKSHADESVQSLARKCQKSRLALAATTAELERLRDELLRRDAHSFVNSI